MGPPTYKLEILWSQTGGSATVYSFYRGHSEFISIFLTCEDTRNLGHKALYCSNRYSRFFILHLMNKFLHLRVKKKHAYHLFNKVKGQSIRWALQEFVPVSVALTLWQLRPGIILIPPGLKPTEPTEQCTRWVTLTYRPSSKTLKSWDLKDLTQKSWFLILSFHYMYTLM